VSAIGRFRFLRRMLPLGLAAFCLATTARSSPLDPASPAAEAAQAQAGESKFKVLVDGGIGFSIDYSASSTFQEFHETGSVAASYKNKTGPGFLGGLEYALTRSFAIRASGSYMTKDGSASWTGSFPHPLYFNQPRSASGDVSSLSYNETSLHLDAVFTTRTGPVDLSLFAGGSLIKVSADLIGTIQKTETYPFDQVAITSVPTVSASDTPFGLNVGAGVDYKINQRFGVGVQGLFSRAKAKLPSPAGGTVDVDAGGFHVTGGLRIRF
jgi:opacity protein-like surface antigen